MLNMLKTAGLAAVITVGAMMAFGAPAQAQSNGSYRNDGATLEFFIGPGGVRVRASDFCQRNPGYSECRNYNRGGDRNGWDNRNDRSGRDRNGRNRNDRDRWDGRRSDNSRYERSICSPEEAVTKARRLGIRNARVVDVDRRTIDVAGRRYGERVIITFGRNGNCPIVGY
jgi:hypothetical protein